MKRIIFPIILLVVLVFIVFLARNNQKRVAIETQTEQTSKVKVPCKKSPLPKNIEGPYYKEGSPERTIIRDDATTGVPLTLTGTVMDVNCNPIANAWVDFWQADGAGNYDNEAYRLRGHQFTDVNGKYSLNTVVPGEYPGRTPHLHVKVKALESSPIITTQLYIPNQEKNKTDTLFNEATLISINESNGEVKATYDFVLQTD
jgi:protocatechuate 3,4-dioxygenase beta subunit